LHKINCLARKDESLPALLARTAIFLELYFDSDSPGPYHARAMGNPLLDRRTPLELATSRQVIEFSGKISDFERLEEIIEGDLETLDPDKLPSGWRESEIRGQLSFGFADAQNGLPMVEGEVSGTIDTVCQRCLGPLKLPLSAELRLLFADGESKSADDGEFEVWELEEETLRPLELVEEALIMAMPLAAMHEDSDTCPGADVEDGGAGEKIRPFAALKVQMENDN
jgi:DUF177 domain-containing protein